MVLNLRNIRVVDDNQYEVSYDGEGGGTERVVCRVVEHEGISWVEMKPNIFVSSQPPPADSRELVAAVLNYHRARLSEDAGSKGGS